MRPKLSVVIIAYNMSRELPRTVRSFSPLMQRGLSADDYELIIIDNGSTKPADENAMRALAPNASFHRMQNAGVSPVAAINWGIELASGNLIGVCIDGARMASPGLLARALAASALHHRPVIGTIAFHLGQEMQARSVLKGYNQTIEDKLLADVDWQADGYRLFDISVFAGSSEQGWFILPSETNALFLLRTQWRELNGYDPQFVAPGGGLANLDTWRRACDLTDTEIVMLLGEATFHQVHGGIATNNAVSPWTRFHEEYLRLRGQPYMAPTRAPRLFGSLHSALLPTLQPSLQALTKVCGNTIPH